MTGYNFTERIRRILAYGREEAARLAAPFTDADHFVLGLIREREGVGAFVLVPAPSLPVHTVAQRRERRREMTREELRE